MAHTEQPWELAAFEAPLDDWTGARYVIRRYKGAPGGIALIMGGLGEQEERDNAHLVTAAPKLLAALQTALAALKCCDERSRADAIKEARAAIEEATEGHV